MWNLYDIYHFQTCVICLRPRLCIIRADEIKCTPLKEHFIESLLLPDVIVQSGNVCIYHAICNEHLSPSGNGSGSDDRESGVLDDVK